VSIEDRKQILQMSQNSSPDIFLCHNGADKPWVIRLGERLEAESIDATESGRRIRVFLDVWDIEKGENFVARLGSELATGAFVAAVMSPEFFSSAWTTLEWTDIVARDPVNAGGQLLPIRLRDISIDGHTPIRFPAPFNALHHFDFRSEARFEAEFQDLLRRIRKLPLARGRTLPARYNASPISIQNLYAIEAAERVPEILLSNLFPLTVSPPPLFTATASVDSVADIPNESGFEGLTVMIRDGRLVTFVDLEDPSCLLNRLIDPHTIKRVEFKECLRDHDLENLWLASANKLVAAALRKRGIGPDEKGRFYFLPDPKQDVRTVKIGPGKPREVAAKKKHHASGETFWVHYSASIRFRVIGNTPFLRILPSYGFTRDGLVALDHKQALRYRIIWGGRQDSATVLRQLLFWLRFLAEGHEEWTLETGGAPLRISVMPASTETEVGVASDHIQIKALVDESPEGELASVLDSAELGVSDEIEDSEDDDHEGDESHTDA
jgi:hypothetical protein